MINGGDINIINGPDEMLVSGLAMGADGGIGSTYNLMPEKYVSLYDSFQKGDIEAARKTQYEINRIIEVLLNFGSGNPVIRNLKEALIIMGFDMGDAAYPTLPLDKDERTALASALTAAGLDLSV